MLSEPIISESISELVIVLKAELGILVIIHWNCRVVRLAVAILQKEWSSELCAECIGVELFKLLQGIDSHFNYCKALTANVQSSESLPHTVVV